MIVVIELYLFAAMLLFHFSKIYQYPLTPLCNAGIMLGGMGGVIAYAVYQAHIKVCQECKEECELCRQGKEVYGSTVQESGQMLKTMDRFLACEIEKICGLLAEGKLEQAKNILGQICKQIDTVENYPYCGNSLVNAILNQKATEAKKQGMVIKSDVELTEDIGVKASHLCSALTNLIDNALKGCAAQQGWYSEKSGEIKANGTSHIKADCNVNGTSYIKADCNANKIGYMKEAEDAKNNKQLDKNKIAVDARMRGRYVIIRVTNHGSLAAQKQKSHKRGSCFKYDRRSTGHGYGRGIVEEIAAMYHGEFFLEEHYGIVEALLILQI